MTASAAARCLRGGECARRLAARRICRDALYTPIIPTRVTFDKAYSVSRQASGRTSVTTIGVTDPSWSSSSSSQVSAAGGATTSGAKWAERPPAEGLLARSPLPPLALAPPPSSYCTTAGVDDRRLLRFSCNRSQLQFTECAGREQRRRCEKIDLRRAV